MKLRKNEIISPKNVFVPRWKIKNPSEEISDFLGGGGYKRLELLECVGAIGVIGGIGVIGMIGLSISIF